MKASDPTKRVTPLPRHLIDLDHPRPRPSKPGMSTLQVQRWVTSVLAFTLLVHFAGGIVVAAVFTPVDQTSARIGLNIMAGVVSVAAIMAVRAIHGRRIVSAWPVLGLAVTALGLYLTYRR